MATAIPAEYTNFVADRSAVVASRTNSVRMNLETIKDLQKKLVDLIRKNTVLEQEITALSSTESMTKMVESSWDSINQIVDLDNVAFKDDKIIIFTKSLTFTYKDIPRYLGRMMITLTKGGGVRMHNLDLLVINERFGRLFQAPHAFFDGAPCLGNLQNLLPEMIEKRDLYSAIVLSIEFVKSVNDNRDDAGLGAMYWPPTAEWMATADKNSDMYKKFLRYANRNWYYSSKDVIPSWLLPLYCGTYLGRPVEPRILTYTHPRIESGYLNNINSIFGTGFNVDPNLDKPIVYSSTDPVPDCLKPAVAAQTAAPAAHPVDIAIDNIRMNLAVTDTNDVTPDGEIAEDNEDNDIDERDHEDDDFFEEPEED